MQNGKLSPSEIDEIIFVGGSTRIPAVVKAVAGFMEKKALQNINPDEVVAKRAAVQTGILGNKFLKISANSENPGNLKVT
ncbi:Hsp70 family protein [Methanosarcina siciliae]|nr:Hsp70 family protein [Methanosarcina siciliae]